ncbi:MAG: hypothetical protein JXK07_16290 [Spirochaetes bacterium]|nr:hypothetical protein [Spirochaetota bacterium]MBN2769875.1 hypothetical protein [Spirochaetota bacterium]
MSKKLKFIYRKKEDKYIVDYSRVNDIKTERFSILKQINQSHDMFIVLDTELLGVVNPQMNRDNLPLATNEGQQNILNLFLNKNIPHSIRKKYVDYQKKVFGLPVGKSEHNEEVNLAFYFKTGSIGEEIYKQLLCVYDYMIGIESLCDIEVVLDKFRNGEFSYIQDTKSFKYDLVDSLFMRHFYTNYDLKKNIIIR